MSRYDDNATIALLAACCAGNARYLADVLDAAHGLSRPIADLLVRYVPDDELAVVLAECAGDRLEADAIEEAFQAARDARCVE